MAPLPLSLGFRPNCTRVNRFGPNCSGSVMALCDRGYRPALSAALVGPAGLSCEPFMRRSERRRGTPSRWYEDYGLPCELCSGRPRDIVHLVNECPHASLVQLRASRDAELLPFYVALNDSLLDIADGAGALRPPLSTVESRALSAARAGTYAASRAELHFLTIHALTATAWLPDSAWKPGALFPLAAALGRTFDVVNVQPVRLRRLAESWTGWAETRLCSVAAVWRAALAERRVVSPGSEERCRKRGGARGSSSCSYSADDEYVPPVGEC
jgi:hypothetical protein